MKRFLRAIAAAALVLAAAALFADEAKLAKVPPPEVIKSIPISDVAPGMRVKLQLTNAARPIVGAVAQVTDGRITLDLSSEDTGLPGKISFRKDNVMVVWELKPQSKAEKELVAERQRAAIAKVKVEVSERAEKMIEDRKADEKRDKAAEAGLRKAMDVVVDKDREAKMRALLAEFPPDKWTDDKPREIKEKWILYKIGPTPEENRFLEVLNEWKDARDTVAILDAREKEKSGERLLLKFPPSEGWGKSKLDAIAAKEAAGEKLGDSETEFKKVWPDWLAAAEKRIKDVTSKPATPPDTTPAPAPADQGEAPRSPATDTAPATPTPSKPGMDTTKPTIIPRSKPAPAVPPEEKPADPAATK